MAVGEIPGLSALLAWPTDHLTEAAPHWDSVGEHSYLAAYQVWRDATSVDWSGEAAEALRTATHADVQTTSAAVDQLEAAARVARSAASDLYAARSRLRYAVEDARTAGFEVNEDLSVSDRMGGESAAQRAVRQAQAQAFAADIRQRAVQLVGLDAHIASRVTAAVAGIDNAFPQIPAPPTSAQVHAVDNHISKRSPPPPGPVDPKDMTAEQARAAWADINSEIGKYNARCGRTFILPTEQGAYDACIADKGPLLERQAAIRARLEQLGIPVEGEDPAHPGTAEPPFPPPTQISGFTDHGREQINERDGHGVNDRALQDAVEHPTKPPVYETDD
ncbi:hypothetical protein [Mycobacterium kubicae]|uniref:hypothetical protein n=1 Tax=Mycobacterium kubicae TaxID=120959 RepID=UPI000A5D9E2C|nr:hypothetical protein [Mycobacterium kubicae]